MPASTRFPARYRLVTQARDISFQLAMALHRAGRRGEARPLWEKAPKMAEGFIDAKTAQMAKERLAKRP